MGERRVGKRKRRNTKSKGIKKGEKSHTTNVRIVERDREDRS